MEHTRTLYRSQNNRARKPPPVREPARQRCGECFELAPVLDLVNNRCHHCRLADAPRAVVGSKSSRAKQGRFEPTKPEGTQRVFKVAAGAKPSSKTAKMRRRANGERRVCNRCQMVYDPAEMDGHAPVLCKTCAASGE